jgi:hypothetical protein
VRDVRLLNGLLWGLNGLLGAAILAFAWFFLLFPKDAHSLKNYPWDDEAKVITKPPPGGDDGIMKTLPNPLEKRAVTAEIQRATAFKAVLKGTLASEKDTKAGVAFIKSSLRNTELVAYVGEEIRDGEKAYEEFRGWKLVEVGKNHAVFSDGSQQVTLVLDLTSPPQAGLIPGTGGPALSGAKAARIGQPYQSTTFKSQLLSQTENRHVWGLDPDEIEWALQNQDSIMDQAFQVSPSAAGGVRIDSVQAGSIGAARGLIGGDIVKDVNGQPLNSVADVKTLLTSPAMRAQTGMRITIERAGKPVVVEYRPLPR